MCLYVLDALDLTLALTSEFLLVRCKLACSLACKMSRQGLAKGPLGNRPATNKKNETKAGLPFRMWKTHGCGLCDGGHGSAKGRVLVFD